MRIRFDRQWVGLLEGGATVLPEGHTDEFPVEFCRARIAEGCAVPVGDAAAVEPSPPAVQVADRKKGRR
jgi:hypothetical protein